MKLRKQKQKKKKKDNLSPAWIQQRGFHIHPPQKIWSDMIFFFNYIRGGGLNQHSSTKKTIEYQLIQLTLAYGQICWLVLSTNIWRANMRELGPFFIDLVSYGTISGKTAQLLICLSKRVNEKLPTFPTLPVLSSTSEPWYEPNKVLVPGLLITVFIVSCGIMPLYLPNQGCNETSCTFFCRWHDTRVKLSDVND